jgi:hypothetical protein
MVDVQRLRQSKALRRAFLILVVSTGFLAVSANLYIRFHYAAVMPRSPQSETGRIYAVPAQYGGTVYVSRAELDRRNFVEDDLIPIFGVVMVLYFCVGTGLGWWGARPKPGGGRVASEL